MWLMGVTLLTSDPDPASASIVLQRARTAKDAGLDGVVASGREVEAIKTACGREFIVVAPGIRPTAADPHDQRRIISAAGAVVAGSDFIVVGRPITKAGDPRRAAEEVLQEIEKAAKR
jgi:orotidine-5'-phosphate decarboxylase